MHARHSRANKVSMSGVSVPEVIAQQQAAALHLHWSFVRSVHAAPVFKSTVTMLVIDMVFMCSSPVTCDRCTFRFHTNICLMLRFV